MIERSGSIPLTNGPGSIPLTNGSGSRRTKNIRIRIRNTGTVDILIHCQAKGGQGSGEQKKFLLQQSGWKLEQNSLPREKCKNSEWLLEKLQKSQRAGCSSLEEKRFGVKKEGWSTTRGRLSPRGPIGTSGSSSASKIPVSLAEPEPEIKSNNCSEIF
jgi:hypothetical protein